MHLDALTLNEVSGAAVLVRTHIFLVILVLRTPLWLMAHVIEQCPNMLTSCYAENRIGPADDVWILAQHTPR